MINLNELNDEELMEYLDEHEYDETPITEEDMISIVPLSKEAENKIDKLLGLETVELKLTKSLVDRYRKISEKSGKGFKKEMMFVLYDYISKQN